MMHSDNKYKQLFKTIFTCKLKNPSTKLILLKISIDPMGRKKTKISATSGKVTPLFFSGLFIVLCAASIFLIHPLLYFLKYFAAFGLVIGLMLIYYILKSDEL